MSNTAEIPLIDVRLIPPPERHPRIFGLLTTLEPGAAMHVASDHDPRPLHYQIESRYPEQFDWNYLEQGPMTWRVEITRAKSSGCDCCCGH
ncbi:MULTISPECIES: DUF2249 domain-containing protein [Pseudorhizobium]|jgi:uncharacterized protein (DUF2249 family)|uniref:Amylo-alpha-1,6-glucosidase family n=2 Tax=Pseudorhizobium TaxID=1903858 RepID=L0NJW6_9HYPH|nr:MULTISPECIES: DUF2249 domain-containing protein [Pseudorhizobium]CAD6600425.1 hypothetical protein RTCK_00756 [Rhizobium sp. TCK]CAD6620327.1 hypothetical protein RNT25_03930 [arsenite-oxidising bacterium NT-25]MBB6180272.1 uncharacterized protein (DUF2249 family) [Pseudorhizobium flavum]CAD6618029.1 hypothetical protein RFYW14_03539 [Pseudorhizobium flavum]CCF21370.1 Amylo-alpha-1,6-glucosidase family [Pseudorhizobium banfieldiae]